MTDFRERLADRRFVVGGGRGCDAPDLDRVAGGVAAVVLVGTSPRRRRELFTWRLVAWMVGPTALAFVGSWLWIAYASFEVSDDRADRTLTLATALRQSIDAGRGLMRQTIGVLGWLDTFLPSFVYLAWGVALVIVVFIHLRSADRRGIAALVALVARVVGTAAGHQRVHQLARRADLSGPLLAADLRRLGVPADVV